MKQFLHKMHEVFIPMLPKKFDENEWFTIGITLLVFFLYRFLHKKMKVLLLTEVIAILLFNSLYATVGDYFLAMKPYDFYDTVDRDSGEIMDILLQNIVYPFSLLILMHFYAKYRPNKILYILFGTLLLFALEWIGVTYFQLFTYKTWKSWYSLFFYLPVMILNIIFFLKFHKYIMQKRQELQNR